MLDDPLGSVRLGGAQATDVTYAFHTLGWFQFQNLCGTILRDTLGQMVETSSQGRDGGRDAAFFGHWKVQGAEDLSGAFAFQVKYTRDPSAPLTQSLLRAEVEKAVSLRREGLCDVYIVITNHRVNSQRNAELCSWLREETGIPHVRILDAHWITQTIRESSHLRMLAPRVYGLGDLSEILDERVYEQARAILTWMQPLRTVVTTAAMEKAARVLNKHRFVFLVGDAMTGKTTTACSLAIAALDHFNLRVLKLDSAEAFAQHWNATRDAAQFFWIDDAFGDTIYDESRARSWGRNLDALSSAIQLGACVVFTSRTYIWNEARVAIKTYLFDLFHKSEVVVRLEDLSSEEQRQILYNHIRMGFQPVSMKQLLRPLLPALARIRPFYPEAARRLGDPHFTEAIEIGEYALHRFFEKPHEILRDVVTRLDASQKALLALIFARGGSIPAPLSFDQSDADLIKRFGCSVESAQGALGAMLGVFVRHVIGLDQVASYQFVHPSLTDAIASMTGSQPEWLEIYLSGASLFSIIQQTSAGGEITKGVDITVPAAHYDTLIRRIAAHALKEGGGTYWTSYLKNRAGRRFLERALLLHPELFDEQRHYFGDWDPKDDDYLQICSRLDQLGLLSDEKRLAAVSRMKRYVRYDLSFLDDPKIVPLRTAQERSDIVKAIASDPSGYLDSMLDHYRDDYSSGEDPEGWFAGAYTYIDQLEAELAGDRDVLDACGAERAHLDDLMVQWRAEHDDRGSSQSRTFATGTPLQDIPRGKSEDPDVDFFQDVADPL